MSVDNAFALIEGHPSFHNSTVNCCGGIISPCAGGKKKPASGAPATRQYKFTVGTTPQSVVGNLTWNANGSLGQLQITDPFNSANQQTCTYSHDDLSRIASVNCGTGAWQQNFSYDNYSFQAGVTAGPFGNIIKTVPTGGTGYSFQPTYNLATNQIASLPGFTPSYDSNGNVLNDSLHQYAWNADGHPISIDSVSLTVDALGRTVEFGSGSTYTQLVYGPTGNKLALMNGQTLVKAFVRLPGRATAVYTSAGLAYYRHSDWLGSSRFASTPSRTMYSAAAYAPFGESYAQAGSTDLSFTGQNSDMAGGSYDFQARQYSIQGRWPSPDPAGLGAASLSDPQKWNRYAYVRNNPLSLVDPLGYDDYDYCTDSVGRGRFAGAWANRHRGPWHAVDPTDPCGGGGGGGGGGGCDAESGDCGGDNGGNNGCDPASGNCGGYNNINDNGNCPAGYTCNPISNWGSCGDSACTPDDTPPEVVVVSATPPDGALDPSVQALISESYNRTMNGARLSTEVVGPAVGVMGCVAFCGPASTYLTTVGVTGAASLDSTFGAGTAYATVQFINGAAQSNSAMSSTSIPGTLGASTVKLVQYLITADVLPW